MIRRGGWAGSTRGWPVSCTHDSKRPACCGAWRNGRPPPAAVVRHRVARGASSAPRHSPTPPPLREQIVRGHHSFQPLADAGLLSGREADALTSPSVPATCPGCSTRSPTTSTDGIAPSPGIGRRDGAAGGDHGHRSLGLRDLHRHLLSDRPPDSGKVVKAVAETKHQNERVTRVRPSRRRGFTIFEMMAATAGARRGCDDLGSLGPVVGKPASCRDQEDAARSRRPRPCSTGSTRVPGRRSLPGPSKICSSPPRQNASWAIRNWPSP